MTNNPQQVNVGIKGGEIAQERVYGMSLRDYFAGQALAGILAGEGSTTDRAFGGFAIYAYEMADAMLAERAKGGW